MKLHVLVEGRSEEAFLKAWLCRARPFVNISFILHQGKSDLLAQLPAKLRAYERALDPSEHRLLVLIDADRDDCKALKALSEYVQDSPIGTAELFQRVIGAGSLTKVAWAKNMGFRLSVDPAENRSPSFRHLISALDRLLA